MRKIDLHIHTVSTVSDPPFEFSLEAFSRYVDEARLDAVAVTNHDTFDSTQFLQIQRALKTTVFPGIEVSVENGHLLVISEPSDLEDFASKAQLVARKINKQGDTISLDEFLHIYGDLDQYLLIPHSDKSPPIDGETLERLRPYVSAGEVDSPKKFIRAIRENSKLPPVLFSDARMRKGLTQLPIRQTFVDCGVLTLSALKATLRDKSKIALSESDGNRLWQVFENGQMLSTGLNVVIGARSSGKTYTLNSIRDASESVKFIEQFSLVQDDDATSERAFKGSIERKRSSLADEHLSGLKQVLDLVINVDLAANHKRTERYLTSLLKSAAELDRHDNFSKAALYAEEEFPAVNVQTLVSLIEAVRHVIENTEFRPIIETYLDLKSVKALARHLIELYFSRTREMQRKAHVNSLIKEIKAALRLHSSATQVEDVDLYSVSMDERRVQRFCEIVRLLKREVVIFEDSVRGFRIEARREPFRSATELKSACGVKTSLVDAFRKYDRPYEYLLALKENEALSRADLYKLFVKVSYKILNEDGFEVSGGERSEFRLLEEITEAQNCDILLIDEPESSFDNLFLKSDVNQILKAISKNMPVVVVTHNSTVGASVGADYVLCTRKELEDGSVVYRTYSGYPTDKQLLSTDGRAVANHEIIMDALEAGADAYEDRRKRYEAIKY